MSLMPLLVVEPEDVVQLQIILRLTKTAIAVGVPQDAVILVGDDKRYAYLRIVLEQVLVPPFHVQLFRLVLPQSVEGLIGRAVEDNLPLQTVALCLCHFVYVDTNFSVRYPVAFKVLPMVGFLQESLTPSVAESHFSGLFTDNSLDTCRFYTYRGLILVNGEIALLSSLGRGDVDNEALRLFRQFFCTGSTYSDYPVVDNL